MPDMEYEIFSAPYGVCQFPYGCSWETERGLSDEDIEQEMTKHYQENHAWYLNDHEEQDEDGNSD